jgi:hypothetical protein
VNLEQLESCLRRWLEKAPESTVDLPVDEPIQQPMAG